MQPKGLLTVVGSLDVTQFWPTTKGTKSSDGDTVHLKVNPDMSFVYSASPGAKPNTTTKFNDAYVIDHGKHTNVITSKSEIKVRLQGIDTPELHMPVLIKRAEWHPSKRGKFGNEFRQPYGAGAANALYAHLKGVDGAGGSMFLHVFFVTHIDHPNDAVDSHGRFVGDILVGTSSGQSINTWLVENGWAFPLLYDSMTTGEVQTIVTAWKTGRNRAARPGKALQRELQPFDPTANAKNAKLPDGGKLNFPKVFRRQATFWPQVAGPLTGAEFVTRLKKGLKGKPDSAYPLDYFLKNIDHLDRKKRIKWVTKIGSQGQTLFKPEDLVFNEDPSTLWDASGNKVTRW